MGIPSEFLPMMRETVVLKANTTMDAYGKQSFAASGVSYNARLIFDVRMVRDADGREVVQAGKAIIYGAVASLNPSWQITLPDNTNPKITFVDTIQDEDGDHHSVVGFGQG
jgi:hypothetical protein